MFVIVDDYSRFTWTIFLRSKDEVHSRFSELVLSLEKSLSLSVRAIRSDHGTEFENAKMLTFCREKGITHNFSAPYTPQQNGVVERKNRTLQDMSRTMLLSSGLAPTYWAEAVNTACYIINRAMPHPILDKTPYELIKGIPPNISHLRTFGCKCFIHNNGKDNLGKFDPRSDKAIFLGYSSSSKAYKVLNMRTQKFEESVHVVFNENLEESTSPLTDDPFPEYVDIATPIAQPVHKTTTLNPLATPFAPSRIETDDSDSESEPTAYHSTNVCTSLVRYNHPSGTNTSTTIDDDDSATDSSMPTLSDDEPRDFEGIFHPVLPDLPSFAAPGNAAYDISPTHSANNSGHVTPTNEPSTPTGSGTSITITTSAANTAAREVALTRDHPPENMLTPLHSGIQTRASSLNLLAFNAFVSLSEPRNIKDSIVDPDWVVAMQEELQEFERNKVWRLVPRPTDKTIIGTRWVFRNKLDDSGVVIRNKA